VLVVVDASSQVRFNKEKKIMAQDRRKESDRRSKPSASTIARQDLQAAESLVRQSGNRLAIGDAVSRIKRARSDREKRQTKRNK